MVNLSERREKYNYMDRFFSQDNLLIKLMTKVFDIALLNILWLLCCVPVITIGASTSALYYVTLKMVKEEDDGIIKSFFKAFKTNFKVSLPITLIFIAVYGFVVFNLYFLTQFGVSYYAMVYGVCIAVLLMAGMCFGYIFPLVARFDNTVKNHFINAAKLCVSDIVRSLFMFCVNHVFWAWLFISPETFVYIMWVILLFGGSIAAYINSRMIIGIFEEQS